MSTIKIPIQPEIDQAKLKSESAKAGKLVENEFEKTGKNAGNSLYSGISNKLKDLKGGISDSFSSLKGGDIQGAMGGLVGSVSSFAGAWGVAGAAIVGIGTKIYDVVAETMKLQNQVSTLTGLTGSQLSGVTANISAISKTFDASFEETLKAANSLAKGMGIPIEEAMKAIEDGFINGANSGGEFLAQLTEYPTFFKEAGLNAQQMGSYIAEASKQGIFADKGGDLIKESTLRLREMATGTKDALKGIGLDGDVIQNALKDGTMTIFEAMQQITGKMGELPAKSAEVGTAIADIFGGPGEDVGLPFLLNLSKMNLQTEMLTKNMTYAQREQKAQLESQKSQELILNKITSALTPLIVGMKELYSNALKWVIDGIQALGKWFDNLWNSIQPVVNIVKDYLLTVWENIVLVFKNVWEQIKVIYDLFQALYPVLKLLFIPLLATLAVSFGIAYGAMKILNVVLKALNWAFQQIAEFVKKEVVPIINKAVDAFNNLIAPIKEAGEWLLKKLGFLKETEISTEKTKDNTDKTKENTEAQKAAIWTLDDYIKALVKLDGKEFDVMFGKALKLKNETDKLADATKRVTTQLELSSDKGFSEFSKSISESIPTIQDNFLSLELATMDFGNSIELAMLGKPDAFKTALQGRLDLLKESLEQGKITQQEYADKKAKIIDEETTKFKEGKQKEFDTTVATANATALAEKEIAEKEAEIKKEKFQTYLDFTTQGLDILLSTEKTNLGERLKAFALYLVDVIEKSSIASIAETTISALAKAPATWGASIVEGLLYIAGIKIAATGAKALLGAEDGTDFGKPLNLHKGKPKGKDSILMAITPDEYNYGIMSDKALSIGKNREYASMMNKGINIESMVLRNQSNLNDVNIVRQLQASNQRLERIERSNMEVAKRFNSNSTVNVNTKQDINLKVDNMGNWRY